jgi:membrane-bound serine protease (ClpP class)
MWQQFIDLFADYGLVSMLVMIFGLLMCMIEVVIPGFGVFGFLGSFFTMGGMVSRIILGATWVQILAMFILIVVIVVTSVLLVIIFAKIGLLGKVSIIQEKTVVPTDYEQPTKEQLKLVGKTGFAHTVFKPSGKLILNGTIYDAISDGEFIEQGQKIKVVEIKNNNIIVKKV